MRKVMAFGTFDGLHPGHRHYLGKAKEQGDYLVVVVARDSNVLKVKGRRPKKGEGERLGAVKALDFVDLALLGDREMREWGIIKRQRPAVIALGYDQWASIASLRKELGAAGIRPEIVRVGALEPEKFKSSKLGRG